MTEAFKDGQPIIDRINTAKRSLEILEEMEGKPWPTLPMFSPGRRIGMRCADEVLELTISMQEGRMNG